MGCVVGCGTVEAGPVLQRGRILCRPALTVKRNLAVFPIRGAPPVEPAMTTTNDHAPRQTRTRPILDVPPERTTRATIAANVYPVAVPTPWNKPMAELSM
jgi:hypothetical protein